MKSYDKHMHLKKKKEYEAFLVAVLKDLPANEDDTGSIPGPGRSTSHGATKAAYATITEHSCPRAHVLQPEEPEQ